MEIESLETVLLDNESLQIVKLTTVGTTLRVRVKSNCISGKCPSCGRESAKRHSHYEREPQDLPWGSWTVVIELYAKRFFCHNQQCEKKTFAERFPDWLASYGRQTVRAKQRQGQLALEMNAKTTERVLVGNGLAISDTTVNRYIREMADPEPEQPAKIIGIDDWAKRKGQSYGTIIVDHESGDVIDVLSDRESKTVQKWLEDKPEVEIVTRDRADNYAIGVGVGSPNAIQIADRFHLLQNATEMLVRVLSKNPQWLPVCLIESTAASTPISETCATIEPQQVEITTETLQIVAPEPRSVDEERFDAVKRLQMQGLSCRAVTRELQIDRRTVAKYYALTSYDQVQSPRRRRKIDSYLTYLVQRWEEGETNRVQLHSELQAMGFTGTLSTLYRETGDWVPNRLPQPSTFCRRRLSAREAAWLLIRAEADLSQHQQALRFQLLQNGSQITTLQQHTRSFIDAIKESDLAKLDNWLHSALDSSFKQLRNFAKRIKDDYACIKAALSYPYSNGRTEGHVNRLKTIKRMMYGRANFDLLRKRVLLQGQVQFHIN